MLSVLSQIKERLFPKPTLEKLLGSKEFVLGYEGKKLEKAVTLSDDELNKSVLIVGSNGMGHQHRYFYPTMHKIDNKANSSMFVIDDGSSYEIRKNLNEKRIMFELGNEQSHKFNWIPLCKGKDNLHMAKLMAQCSLYRTSDEANNFHHDLAAEFLAAIYIYIANTDTPTPINAYKLICETEALSLVKLLMECDIEVVRQIASVISTMDKQLIGKYLLSINNNLEWLKDERVISLTNTTEVIDFARLRKEKVSVYVNALEEYWAMEKRLELMILNCALVQLIESKEGNRVYLFVKYLAHLGYISWLSYSGKLRGNIFNKNNITLIASSPNNSHPWLKTYIKHSWLDTCSKEDLANLLHTFHTKVFLEDYGVGEFMEYLPEFKDLIGFRSTRDNPLALCIKRLGNEQLVLINGRKPFLVEFPPKKTISSDVYLTVESNK
ncbi:MAG: hypothetical protein WAQ98_31855 [Blastocatellia bacterium]